MIGLKTGIIAGSSILAPVNKYAEFEFNSKIDLPSNLRLDFKSFSVEVKFKLRANIFNFDRALLGSNTKVDGTYNDKLHLVIRDRNPLFDTWSAELISTTFIAEEVWLNLAFTYNSITEVREMFLNGEIVASNGGYQLYRGIEPLTIGQWYGNNDRGLIGSIDYLRIHDKVLTLAEINESLNTNYITQKPQLIANYPLNGDCLDYSGNNHHGTPFNIVYINY